MPLACKKNHVSHPARSLYVHVPLCAGKCGYCDFYSLLWTPGRAERYLEALGRELALHRKQVAAPLESIFIGGGTPTSLSAEGVGQLDGLLAELAGADTEWTIEANPSSLDEAKLSAWLACGVNRISLGVQSFQPAELAVLARREGPEQIARAAELLGRAGVENWNLDLIYGIPGQSEASWSRTLERALSLGPSHVSCYALGIEAGTELMARVRTGALEPVDDELQRAMYYQAVDTLDRAGLEHYELSNFAAPGRACKHNVSCWQGGSYLGLGPAAASYLHGVRRSNRADLDTWAEALLAGEAAPADVDERSKADRIGEALMLGLRLIAGVDEAEFAERFGVGIDEAIPQSLTRHQAGGLLDRTGGQLRLTRAGWFLADTVLVDCLDEAKHLDVPRAGR